MIETIFKDIVNHSFDGVIVIGDDYRIAYMNGFAAEITGFSNKEARNHFCYEVLRAKCCKDNCPIRALKQGEKLGVIFVDIIAKDNSEKFIKTKVIPSHGYWIEIFQDVTRETELEKRIKERYIFGDIITQDKRLIDILREFPRIAESGVPVMFEGESGVGKEVFSTAIQSLSGRKDRPFVKINCASLPETLLESELFGYKKGAFTDARKDKPGLFRIANRGTLFLDEIGEMSLPLQTKLLRAVETGEIIPLGAVSPEKVDVRILAATNKDLVTEVKAGNFREDLFYRLNVVKIKIPPLRERKGDIPLFIDYFINHFNIIRQKKVTGISPEVLEILLGLDFPGNIRELRNIFEYAFIFCSEGEILEKHLPEYVKGSVSNDREQEIGIGASPGSPLKIPVSGERERLLAALESTFWNKSKAAEILKIDRTTLWRKMKMFNIGLK
jgi:transcriptional regulator with PAS, ATPase and Fis domain